jgi:hypothetical protein
MSLTVIASEAKKSTYPLAALWIALWLSLLAMTTLAHHDEEHITLQENP